MEYFQELGGKKLGGPWFQHSSMVAVGPEYFIQ